MRPAGLFLLRGYSSPPPVASDRNQSQHQRHELVRDIAAKEDRHRILLTATPHSSRTPSAPPCTTTSPGHPNRFERGGRVDRYGQEKPTVRRIRYFSPDSAVDGSFRFCLRPATRERLGGIKAHL